MSRLRAVIATEGREVTVDSCPGTPIEDAVQEALDTWRRRAPQLPADRNAQRDHRRS